MLLYMLLMGSLAFTAGQYTAYETTTTASGQPISTSPQTAVTTTTTTQGTTSQSYNYPVVTGLRLKAKCFKELNTTVAEQLLKQYLLGIPPEFYRLTVKNIRKL